MDRVQESEHSLQFENYEEIFCENLTRYFNKSAFVNVTLICNGETIMAHQVVLSACSQFFENALINRSEPHPIIVFTDIQKKDMIPLLEFMYTGHVSVDKNLLPSLLKTAKTLEVRGLNYEKIDNTQTNLEEVQVNNTAHNLSAVSPMSRQVNNAAQNFSPVSSMSRRINNTAQNLSAVSPTSRRVNNRAQNLSPVSPTSRRNSTVNAVEASIEGQVSDKDEAPRWQTSSSNSVQRRRLEKKVLNPFAVKSRSSSDSDSTIFDDDPCVPGPSKISFRRDSPPTVSTRVQNESDVEFIDNEPSVLVIPDTQVSDFEIERKVHRRSKTNARTMEGEFTSDESEKIISTKKLKTSPVVDNSVDKRDVVPIVRTSATLENAEAGPSSRNKRVNPPVTVKSENLNQSTSNDCDIVWRREMVEEPFEGYLNAPWRKLCCFCIICKQFKCRGIKHITKYHNMPSRGKRFCCQKCSKKFSRKEALELHKCQSQQKR